MRRQGLHDPLTGLPNRTLFMDRLSLALNQAARRKTSVAVLFLDLDRFKLVNDSLGHGAGDELLCMLADAADRGAAPGRHGRALRRRRVLRHLRRPRGPRAGDRHRPADDRRRSPGRSRSARASSSSPPASGSRSPTDLARTAEDLVGEADAAMYRAKENGRGGFELFDAVMRGHASERLRVENDLRRALELGDELIAHYQPIVTLDGGDVIGVEALVRWNHPERGLVPPGEFIPVAEESGAILAIGERVLRLACAEAARWNADEPQRPLSVSVNLSPRQVTSPGDRRDGRGRARGDRARPGAADARDHRGRAGHRVRGDGADAARPQGARAAARARRLRHRLLVARLPAALPDRRAQDRPPLHRRDGHEHRGPDDRRGDHQDGRGPADRRRRRGRRDDRAGARASSASAASTRRASTTPGRCPPTTWRSCSSRACRPAPGRSWSYRLRPGRSPSPDAPAHALRDVRADPALAPGRRQDPSRVSVASTTRCASARFQSSCDHWSRRPRTVSRTDALVIPTAPPTATAAEARPVCTTPVSYSRIRCGSANVTANRPPPSAIDQRR